MQVTPLILIVNDEIGALTLMRVMLERNGYSVMVARDANGGLQLLHDFRPNLLITDDMMPGMYGPDMVRQIRNDHDVSSVPILLTTVRGDAETILTANDVGCDEVLIMPFLHHDLLAAVERMLEAHKTMEPFNRGSALLMHGTYPERGYLRQICQSIATRVSIPVIALPSRCDGSGRNRHLVEALRASRTLTICITDESLQRDNIRYAYEYFAGHGKPLSAILYEDVMLPSVFDTCHIFMPDELEAYCGWLGHEHGVPQSDS